MSTITPEQLANELLRAGGSEFARVIQRGAVRIGLTGEAEAKRLVRERLRKRSGNLLKSPTSRVGASAAGVSVELSARPRTGGEAPPYAAIQEEGGVVRPRRRKWLAIPTDLAMTGAGVGRYQTAYDYPRPLAFVFLKSGLAMLWDADKGKPAYWLRKQTTIKPKWFLRDAFEAMQMRVPVEFDDAMQQALGFTVSKT